MPQLLWKTVEQFLKKLKTESSYDPSTLFLDIYPKISKAGTEANTCTPMFTAALCTTAKRKRQPLTDVHQQMNR